MHWGVDKQYDLSWEEQEKIKRRLDLKHRLKQEGIRKRYMDLRKKGRMPGTPIRPTIFFGMASFVFVPIIALKYAIDWERRDYLRDTASGDYPLEKRKGKTVG